MPLNQECIMLQSELKKYAQQVILDKVDELDKTCTFPADNIKQLAGMGVLGAVIPEDMGGAALELIGLAVSLEEISKVCTSTAAIIATHNALFALPILTYGSDEMKKRYLPGAAAGEIIGASALVQTNELTLVQQGDDILINGRNPLVLNAETNGPMTLFAQTGGKPSDISVFVIGPETENIRRTKSYGIMGLRAAGICEVGFDNVKLTPAHLLGTLHNGYEILNRILDYARVCFSGIALGISQGAREEAIKYAKERIQFDQPIIQFGMIREKIALMTTQIEASRHLVYNAAAECDANKNYTTSALIAKHVAGQAAVEITTQAIQIFGGYGYMKEYPVERYFRDAQVINVLCSNPSDEKELIAKGTIG